jgi:DNA-binding IclR family transcriptional regulator
MIDIAPTIAEAPAPKAPAIARAAAILRLLGRSEAPLGVQAIARELGLVPSTCLYVLRALVEEELVRFDPDTKRYALDAGVLTLARGWLRRDRFADLVAAPLDRLAREFGVTVLAVQIVRLDHIIVVAAASGGQALQLSAGVGSRFPALISATGRCIAAFGQVPAADLERRFTALRWDDPPTFAQWQAQVVRTREQGYAIDEGNYIGGVTVLAAPVWKAAGSPSHALVALSIGAALREGRAATLGQALVSAANSISAQLGG